MATIDFHLWHKHARIEKHRSSTVGRKNENCLMTHTVTSLSANLSWWFRVRVGGRSLRRKRATKPLFTLRHGHLHDYGWRDVSREIMMTILRCHQSGNDWIDSPYMLFIRTFIWRFSPYWKAEYHLRSFFPGAIYFSSLMGDLFIIRAQKLE